MSDFEIYGLLAVAMAVCFANWRTGVFICFVVGFLQDPVRKLMPGEPVFMTALVGAPLAMTLLGAHLRRVRISFKPIHSWNKSLRIPLGLFVLLVLVQTVVGFIKTGSAIIAGIGMLAYLAPLPAILLGYQFSRSARDIIRLIKFYVLGSILMVSGIYLSYLGFDWKMLISVGAGLIAFAPTGEKLALYAGFFRSPEIAAWHAATSVCLLIILAVVIRRQTLFKLGAGALAPFLLGAILFTGRRKFLVEIFLFLSSYGLLLLWSQRTAIKSAALMRLALIFATGVAAASVGYIFLASDVTTTNVLPYYTRGASVQQDVGERVSVMTLESFQYVIAQNGVLGSGAGTGSQGAQHFGGGSRLVGGSAEGGIAKVLAELGVPGLVLLLWLAISLVRYLLSVLSVIKEGNPQLSKLAFGLLAFLVTNGFVYAVAHQVFGDPFVLIILGFFLGFVMAMPRIVQKSEVLAARAADAALASSDSMQARPLADAIGRYSVPGGGMNRIIP
ncbi:MAG: hypothetical protein AABO41_16450 [Acidobacteriota bacterium]